MRNKFSQFAIAVLALTIVVTAHSAGPEKKTKLFVGTQGGCNAGVVTTSENHLNCTTKAIGYTIDDASAEPAGGFKEVFVGNTGGVNAGVVSTSANHMDGATESIGFFSKKALPKGTKLYVGTQANCNAGVVTTSNRHLKCSTEFVGYALPE